MAIEIVVLLRNVAIGRSTFEQPVVRIGRSSENEVFIDNAALSRFHAVITRKGSGYVLEDLGTPNGTFVNGQRVATWNLSDGDRISIGKFTLIFACDAFAPVIAPLPIEGRATVVVDAAKPEELEARSPLCAKLVTDDAEYPIARDVFWVGKDPTCDIKLSGWRAPAKLALIARGLSAFKLVSLEGERSVKKNGQGVAWDAWLEDGDVLELGALRGKFVLGSSKEGGKA